MDPKRLYVGNLPDDASVEALRTCFARHGSVADVYMAIDRASGRSLRYAFVTMATEADARAAITGLDGAMFEGVALRVNEAGGNREDDQQRRGNARADAKARNARAAVITSQFREAHNMTYEVDCSGTTLCVRVFPIDQEAEAWRLEVSVRGSADRVSSGVCPTRALALQEIVHAWNPETSSPVDWPAVIEAMAAVRAV
jgi:RNA recognition motif-containing protein